MTKFLETVNALKNKILVPINRIKCVNKTGQTSFSIEIVTDDGSVFEYHKSQEEQDDRYQ